MIVRILVFVAWLSVAANPIRAEESYTAVALAHETMLTAAAFSPDGARVATSGGDGTVRV